MLRLILHEQGKQYRTYNTDLSAILIVTKHLNQYFCAWSQLSIPNFLYIIELLVINRLTKGCHNFLVRQHSALAVSVVNKADKKLNYSDARWDTPNLIHPKVNIL